MRRLFTRLAAAPLAAVALTAFAVPAFADPRDFVFANNTSSVITHLYVSPSETDDWGDDILGRGVVYPGEFGNVTFARFDGSSCLYDVKVLLQQGGEGVLYKVDLCVVTDVSFSDAA